MRVLFLGYPDCRLLTFLIEQCEDVFQTMRPLKNKVLARFDLVVSFGYRFILSSGALSQTIRPPLNLHISFLPWNRGADPNFWSFHDNTPKGVTIHEMNAEADAGPIVFRRQIEFSEDEDDLSKTYHRLFEEIQDLFIEKWPRIRGRYYTVWDQPAGGSYHRSGEMPALPEGWSTKTAALEVETG